MFYVCDIKLFISNHLRNLLIFLFMETFNFSDLVTEKYFSLITLALNSFTGPGSPWTETNYLETKRGNKV